MTKPIKIFILFLPIFVFSFLFLGLQPIKAADCYEHTRSCDATKPCCDFPEWRCTGGYCAQTGSLCGAVTQPCCQPPNKDQCGVGLSCIGNYCVVPTPTPTCGQHGQRCCPQEPKCLIQGDECIGNICEPLSCGNHGDRCCKNPPYCSVAGDVCTSNGICLQPTPTPAPIPPTSKPGAIDFGRLSGAIPSLKPIFQPGPASNVGGIISLILPYLFVIAGLLLLFYLIYGGFHMIIAAGDEKGLAEAKAKITNALLGFLLLFVSYWIVQILEIIFGIKIF